MKSDFGLGLDELINEIGYLSFITMVGRFHNQYSVCPWFAQFLDTLHLN